VAAASGGDVTTPPPPASDGGKPGSDGGPKPGNDAAPPPNTNGSCDLFPCDNPWYKDVSGLPAYTAQDIPSAIGAWGRSNTFTIDFSIVSLVADASTPKHTFQLDSSYDPDNDHDPVPVPATGNVEGESGYLCSGGGDCHLIVVDTSQNKLFELWQASYDGSSWTATQQTTWDLTKHYGPDGRGQGCTSADAAGLSILAGLIRPGEVGSGEIKHALRFILPGSKIKKNGYVAPATHSTSAYSGQAPMGVRLRLKASYAVDSLPSQGARVVARALQKYGMLLADAGQDALTAEDDRYSSVKWSGLLGARDLTAIKVSDFEAVDVGTVHQPSSMDCTRAP
jgi:serine/threonine-protein kinase